ncbi:hypothetical protein ACP3V5_17395 [Vibrio maritimus]
MKLVLIDADQFHIPLTLRDLSGRDVSVIASSATKSCSVNIDNLQFKRVECRKEAADLELILEANTLLQEGLIDHVTIITRDHKLADMAQRLAERYGVAFLRYGQDDWLHVIRKSLLNLKDNRKKITRDTVKLLKQHPNGLNFENIARQLSMSRAGLAKILEQKQFTRIANRYYC